MRVYWKDDSYSFSGEIIQWSKVPVYPDCQHFDLLQYLGSDRVKSGIQQIEFLFWNRMDNEDTELYLHIEDRNRALKRRLSNQNILAYSGFPIKDLNVGRYIKTAISFSQTLDVERCIHYPHLNFADYNQG